MPEWFRGRSENRVHGFDSRRRLHLLSMSPALRAGFVDSGNDLLPVGEAGRPRWRRLLTPTGRLALGTRIGRGSESDGGRHGRRSDERPSLRGAVRHHVSHLDPCRASLPAPVLDDPAGYIAGGGTDTQIYLRRAAGVPPHHRERRNGRGATPGSRGGNSEILAIGYVGARIIECVFIAGGHHLRARRRQPASGRSRSTDLAVSFAALKDWTLLFGPGLVVPFGNGLILGCPDVQVRPHPAAAGRAGSDRGPSPPGGRTWAFCSALWEVSGLVALFVAPEFAWELLLGLYAAIWGFRRAAPILSDSSPVHPSP